MRIAICDDNQTDLDHLSSLLGEEHTTACFSTAEELLILCEEQGQRFELYLLDIFMGGMSGLELARRLRAMDPDAILCFITTSRDCYEEAFALYAFQYLLKPVQPAALQELLHRAARQHTRDRGHALQLSFRSRSVSIPYGQVLFITSQGHSLFVYCKNGQIERHVDQLNHLESLLDHRVFARCHQSYLVNLYNISSLNGNEFFCEGHRIPISRRYAAVKERYRSLLFEDME